MGVKILCLLYTGFFLLGGCLGKHRLHGKIRYIEVNSCECGTTEDLSFRIVGGEEVTPHTYPWMAIILNNGQMHCGGALINDRYILTAAHCLRWVDKSYITVTLGIHRREEALQRGQISPEIEKFIIHENFTTNDVHDTNDIALIKLKNPVQFTPEVRPICLPKKRLSFANRRAAVLGWGRISSVGRAASSLLGTNLTVLTQAECKRIDKIGPYILDSMLCAMDSRSDACQGDSGGPLIYKNPNDFSELIGLVSWGIGCATPGIPGVYTRITYFIEWIYDNTWGGKYCKRPLTTKPIPDFYY